MDSQNLMMQDSGLCHWNKWSHVSFKAFLLSNFGSETASYGEGAAYGAFLKTPPYAIEIMLKDIPYTMDNVAETYTYGEICPKRNMMFQNMKFNQISTVSYGAFQENITLCYVTFKKKLPGNKAMEKISQITHYP